MELDGFASHFTGLPPQYAKANPKLPERQEALLKFLVGGYHIDYTVRPLTDFRPSPFIHCV